MQELYFYLLKSAIIDIEILLKTKSQFNTYYATFKQENFSIFIKENIMHDIRFYELILNY